MTLNNDEDLERLKEIGRICANAVQIMGAALEPGMTTADLDAIGRKVLEDSGARSAPDRTRATSIVSSPARPSILARSAGPNRSMTRRTRPPQH